MTPFLQLEAYDPTSFLRAIETALADPTFVLSVPIEALLTPEHQPQIKKFFAARHAQRQGPGDYLAAVLPVLVGKANPIGIFGAALGYALARRKHDKAHVGDAYVPRFTVERALHSMPEKEKALLRAVAALVAQRLYAPHQWHTFLALLAWNGGNCRLVPAVNVANHPEIPAARALAQELIKSLHAAHEPFLTQTAADVALHRHATPELAAVIDRVVSDGARWMTPVDLATSRYFSSTRTPASLFLGYLDGTKTPVLYAGHESLITIAGPGSGKSSALVIPNLLAYPGSAVVLDVKGELWEKTAHRRQSFGPIYRFAPTDESGQSHCFNPFDLISRNPADAANEWTIFAEQIILERANNRDPYWEGKAREFIWALGMLITFTYPKDKQTLQTLAELMSTPVHLDYRSDPPKPDPRTMALIRALTDAAAKLDLPDLRNIAVAIEGGLGEPRLESVFDAGRRHISAFARSQHVRRALSRSDWSPNDLRSRPGMTVYICVDDPAAFAPVIRLLLFQHFRILRRHAARPDEAPITYFLDEMPRLGNFTQILDMQDVGRSAGLRLWMFAQSYGQLRQHFEKRAEGIVNGCRLALYLQPQTEEIRFIKPFMGEVRNIFNGEKRPLAREDELAGERYGQNIIVTTRGARPMLLSPRFAHASKTLARLIKPPPHIVYPK